MPIMLKSLNWIFAINNNNNYVDINGIKHIPAGEEPTEKTVSIMGGKWALNISKEEAELLSNIRLIPECGNNQNIFPQFLNFLSSYKKNGNRPYILSFGDSVTTSIANEDTDRRGINHLQQFPITVGMP